MTMDLRKVIVAGGIATAVTALLVVAGGAVDARQERGRGGGMDAMRLFETFDRDGDGRVTIEEVEQGRGERFAAFDANGDGVLDLAEYEQLWLDAMRRRMVRGFQFLDADGDGQVTADEFAEPWVRRLQRLDRAGEGAVSREQLMERGRGRRGGD